MKPGVKKDNRSQRKSAQVQLTCETGSDDVSNGDQTSVSQLIHRINKELIRFSKQNVGETEEQA